MLTEAEILKIFEDTNVLQRGHFRFSSGRHSAQYLQLAQLLQYPEHAALVCAQLAEHFKDDEVETVIGPALGGIIIAYEVARSLGVRSILRNRKKTKSSRPWFHTKREGGSGRCPPTGASVNEVMELCGSQ